MEPKNTLLAHDVDADLLRMAANPLELLLEQIDLDSLRAALEIALADPATKCVRLEVAGLPSLDFDNDLA